MNYRFVVTAIAFLFLADIIPAAEPSSASSGLSGDEQTIWNKERAYWQYVEKNDLTSYGDLWHENFLGWPSVSATPVRKDHITDWITSQTSKGLSCKPGEFKPAALKVTGDVAACAYWIAIAWVDQKGNGAPPTITRITHTWLKTGGEWRIISGMSMPESKPMAK